MPPLQRGQFEKLAEEANANPGGFSVDVKTGRKPRSGIMVSQAGSERRLTHPTTGGHLEQYAGDYKEPLEAPGAKFGTWHPKDGPKVDADVSMRFPTRRRRSA